jgi:hypothetical protein
MKRTVIGVALAASALSLSTGCGASDAAKKSSESPSDEGPGRLAPAAEPAPLSAEDARRAAEAEKTLKILNEIHDDPPMRGRVATQGMAELEPDRLPPDYVRALEAIAGNGIDPSQAARIIGSMGEEPPGSEIVEKACGKPLQALWEEVQAQPVDTRAKAIAKACGLEMRGLVSMNELTGLNPMSPILVLVVHDILAAKGPLSKAEVEIIRAMINVRPPGERP